MNERSARGERDHLGRVLPVLKIRYRDRPRYFFWQLFFFDDVALNKPREKGEWKIQELSTASALIYPFALSLCTCTNYSCLKR